MPDVERPERLVPGDPLQFIRNCVRERRVLWTFHVRMRLRGRSISRETILEAVDSYEIVESYPEDKYLPSYLVLGRTAERAFHVLFAADVTGGNVRVVTAYRASRDEWKQDLRTRRSEP